MEESQVNNHPNCHRDNLKDQLKYENISNVPEVKIITKKVKKNKCILRGISSSVSRRVSKLSCVKTFMCV